MKKVSQLLLIALALATLVGCAATVPVKVAAKTTKLGVKATTATVKAGTKVLSSDKEEPAVEK